MTRRPCAVRCRAATREFLRNYKESKVSAGRGSRCFMREVAGGATSLIRWVRVLGVRWIEGGLLPELLFVEVLPHGENAALQFDCELLVGRFGSLIGRRGVKRIAERDF